MLVAAAAAAAVVVVAVFDWIRLYFVRRNETSGC